MITGKKVILRPIAKEDLKKFFEWHNDVDTKALAFMHPFPVTLESEEVWYEEISKSNDNRQVFFSVVEKQNNQLIGFIKLYNINWIHRYSYFGIIIGEKSVYGKGIGTEATKLGLIYAFEVLNLRKIVLEVVEFNEIAINLYRKLGFAEEGRLKDLISFDNKWNDLIIMSIKR